MPDNPDFGTFSCFAERPLNDMPADQWAAYAFTMERRGQIPGPHKIWLANPKLKVQAQIAGLPTAFDDARQQVVREVASVLIAPRVVPTGLCRGAVDLLGDAGLVDLTVLIGYFTGVSLTLRACVPPNATGLNR